MLLTITDLIAKRKKYKISQTELANVVGMFPSGISRLESGALDCRISTLELINAGLDIIKANKYREFTGLIVLDKTDFMNTIHKSIIAELEQREHEGQYKGNAHHLAQELVDLIVKGVCENENDK